jgi:hypothetical protein
MSVLLGVLFTIGRKKTTRQARGGLVYQSAEPAGRTAAAVPEAQRFEAFERVTGSRHGRAADPAVDVMVIVPSLLAEPPKVTVPVPDRIWEPALEVQLAIDAAARPQVDLPCSPF